MGEGKSLTFKPGVFFTNVHQVKGLEFTNVILWNPSQAGYKDRDLDRNLLYVGITRACDYFEVLHHLEITNLLKEALGIKAEEEEKKA